MIYVHITQKFITFPPFYSYIFTYIFTRILESHQTRKPKQDSRFPWICTICHMSCGMPHMYICEWWSARWWLKSIRRKLVSQVNCLYNSKTSNQTTIRQSGKLPNCQIAIPCKLYEITAAKCNQFTSCLLNPYPRATTQIDFIDLKLQQRKLRVHLNK